MELESVMVRCGVASGDVRRLCRAGGEVWQEQGVILDADGRVCWRYALVKLPAAAAIRLGLIAPGGELAEVVDGAEGVAAAGHPAIGTAARASGRRIRQAVTQHRQKCATPAATPGGA